MGAVDQKEEALFFSYDPTPSYTSGNVDPTLSTSHFLRLLSFKIKSLWPEKKQHLLTNHNKQWHLSPFFPHHIIHFIIKSSLALRFPYSQKSVSCIWPAELFSRSRGQDVDHEKWQPHLDGVFFFFGGHKLLFIIWLVVEPTHLKNMLVKLDHFPRVRGENKKNELPPPSYVDYHFWWGVFGWCHFNWKFEFHKKAAKLQDWHSDANQKGRVTMEDLFKYQGTNSTLPQNLLKYWYETTESSIQ